MKGVAASIVGLIVSFVLSTSFAEPAPPGRDCCRVPAGTPVQVELTFDVSTKVQRAGDRIPLRLAAPLIVDGRILLRAGAPGFGVVIQASKPGMGGKAGKLVVAARYLIAHGQRLPLQGLQLSGAGRDRSRSANVVGLSGFAFAPLGFVGLAVPGGNVTFPAGMRATAKLARDEFLPALDLAPRYATRTWESEDDADADGAGDAGDADGVAEIGPPPPGEGQVVFFRRKSITGLGQWFNVRENGHPLGKLSNGAYFVQVTDPGIHTYTAKTEPEVKDHLTLEVDPGESYFVEGTLTKGVVLGEADLTPSSREAFAHAFAGLKPAKRPRGADRTASP